MENFWKEYTILLREGKEYCYDIQNKNTNCVIIRNYNSSKIKIGVKPNSYEIVLNPNRTGILNRPFPLEYIYLLSDKDTPINIIETVIQNPINNFIQQKITKSIITQNTPKIFDDAYSVISTERTVYFPPTRRSTNDTYLFSLTLDCGIYGRPLVNIYALGGGTPSWFNICFSNDNIGYFCPYTWLQILGGYYPHGHERNHITLINAFRYVRVTSKMYKHRKRGDYFRVRISGSRHSIQNLRQLVHHTNGIGVIRFHT